MGRTVCAGLCVGALATLLVGCSDGPLRQLINDLVVEDPVYSWIQVDGDPFEADIPAAGDLFGSSIAVCGDWAAIGSYTESGYKGRVYVLKKVSGTWAIDDRLDGTVAGACFGTAVALSSEYLLVGTPGESSDTGTVSIYELVGGIWTFQKKLTGPAGANGLFGSAIAIDGAWAIIGAPGVASSTGLAYAYYRDEGGPGSWGDSGFRELKPEEVDRSTFEYFGWSVSVQGEYAAVGAYGDNGSIGAAYVFFRNASNNWGNAGRPTSKLTASDGAANDVFGTSVSIYGDHLGVGAPGNDGIYVFTRNVSTWDQQLLVDPQGAIGDKFGSSVAVSEIPSNPPVPVICAGSAESDGAGANAGSAIVFEQESGAWSVTTRLSPRDAHANARFSTSAALWEGTAMVAAPGGGVVSGSAYFFERRRMNP
jgi:hypothetical protein